MRWILTAAVVLGALAVPAVCLSQTVTVEAETFTNYKELGGAPMVVVSCAYASGGQAVDGFDIVEEGIRLFVTFPQDGQYAVRLRSAGLTDATSTVRLTLLTASKNGDIQTSEVETFGYGIG